ncbi:MAG TPA: serine hydrolase domain-containing protein [Thermoanaerobaculia bacterium]|nr:serine hydrolase domain-containing protein [Thermoanaerobaculia bacterium]
MRAAAPLLLLAAGLGAAPASPAAAPAPPLETLAAVGEVSLGADLPRPLADRLRALVDDAARSDRMRSIVLLHRGERALEAHFHGQIAIAPQNLKSITKSVDSLLVGIALDEGLLPGLDATLPALLPEAFAGGRRADKRAITLRQLLTMSSGLALGYGAFQASPDWVGAVLDAPLVHPPGARHHYDTPPCHLLSAILALAAGGDLERFARERLYDPLGATLDTWRRGPDGLPMGGNDLYLRAADIAAVGELMRRGGLAPDGRRVVPRAWVEASLAKQIELPEPTINHGTLAAHGYGYLWWLLDFDGEAAFAALGHGGQELIVFPRRELVVVFTSHWPGPSSTEHYRHLRRLLDEHVLPAFPAAPPERP